MMNEQSLPPGRYQVDELIERSLLEIGDGYRAKNSELSSEGLPFARAGNINSGFQFADADLLNFESVKRAGGKVARPGDILFTSKGTVGRFAFVQKNTPLFVYSPQLCYWRSKDFTIIDPAFLYYWMSSSAFVRQINSVKGQTDMADYVNLRDQRSMYVELPPPPTQHRIAAILSAFDDKIELNRRMNRTLEQMARALFKSWFVDFDPVRAKMRGEQPEGMDAETAALFPDEMEAVEGREVPRGWKWQPFDSRLTIFGGGTPKTSNPDFWGGEIPWYSVVDVPNDGDVWVLRTGKTITEAGVKGSSTRLLPVGTTIISARGTVGKLALTAVPMAMNQSCYGLFPEDRSSINFTYFSTLAAVDELKRRTHGAVFDTITRDTLQSINSVFPGGTIINAFEIRADELSQAILANLEESTYLTQLRDALLPRLLSGEVDVSGWGIG